MATDEGTGDFDWVSAQSACSTDLMFQRLQDGVRKDVERRNAVFGRTDHWRFEFHAEPGNFEVSRGVAEGLSTTKAAFVSFDLDGPRINIHGDGVDVDITGLFFEQMEE